MPVDPVREAEVREETERAFSDLERAFAECQVGVVDVLQVYGGLEDAIRQAGAYLALLNPTPAVFSTTANSNIQE